MKLLLIASIIVTLGPYVLTGGAEYPTEDACIAAAKDGLTTPRECVRKVVITGDCADVPAPYFESTLMQRQCPNDDTRYELGQSRLTTDAYPACWKVVLDPWVTCDPLPVDAEPAANFWPKPKMSPPNAWAEQFYPGPLANPQTPAADDATGTSNTDPPVAGAWLPRQGAP